MWLFVFMVMFVFGGYCFIEFGVGFDVVNVVISVV